MNEEIRMKLIEYLGTMENSVSKAVDFSAEQAPLYVQEVCMYGFTSNMVITVVCAVLFCLGSLVTPSIAFVLRKQTDIDFWAPVICAGIIQCMTIIPLVEGIDHGLEAYKAKFAPRVYIVEQISQAIK